MKRMEKPIMRSGEMEIEEGVESDLPFWCMSKMGRC